MSAIRRLVDELCAALARFDPASWSGSECADLAERLTRAAKACETASARAGARAVECGTHDAAMATALARAGGGTEGAVRAALAAVNDVAACPATMDALVAGEVSLAQAAQIASVPEHEEELLAVAQSSGLRAVKDLARKRRLEGIDPDELYAKQRAAKEFLHWRDELGMVRFRGALTPEVGVAFVNRLDTETDRVWREARGSGTAEPRAAVAANALARMVEGKGRGKARTTDLVLVCDLNAYRKGEGGHIVGGGPIPGCVVRELEKDAFLKAVLHDGVAIHTVAHFGRYRPAELETALNLGPPPEFDGVTCSTPGCDRQHGLQWDHVDPVANGGPTSLVNLQPKCAPCHVEKTELDRKAGLLRGKRKERGP